MSRAVETAAKRRKLPVDRHPVWASIGGARNGLKLGYRKGAKGGVWLAKQVANGQRREGRLALADDDEAGPEALSFTAAVAVAIAWSDEQASVSLTEAAHPPLTIDAVAQNYVAERIARHPKAGRDAKSRLGRHVLTDPIADLPLSEITARVLKDWRGRVDRSLAPATINRLLNDVRAALRAAVEAHWRDLPSTLPKEIEQGLRRLPGTSEARLALLSDADVRAVVDAAFGVDQDLGALVLVLASTGARFSQAALITVSDVQASSCRLMIAPSRKGKGVKARSKLAVPVGEDVLARLAPLLDGRSAREPLLQRWVHRQVSPTEWARVKRAPWSSASEMLRGWKKALVAARIEYVEPYALRHSSIVRMLTAGVPVRIVAALHDTSSAMIEQHYSAHILDMADELARKALVPLISPEGGARNAVM